LVVALISAAVAGIVSFLVAGYQNHVARSQADCAQQTQEVVQMERSAGATVEDLQSVANYTLKCSLQDRRWDNTFDTTIDNATDQRADSLALKFQQKTTSSMSDKNAKSRLKDWADSVKAELDLAQRCGLLIQGFQ
jgi:flagellar basal body-associated protein FliL